MPKRNKRLIIFGVVFLFSVVVLALGLKYFPFTKLVKMPVAPEKEFVNPEKIKNLAPHTLYYDFEIAPGKEMPGGFYKGIAHSGQYSVKAFGQNSFSVAVERTAGEVGVENLKAVAISAWVYVFPTKKEVKASLVFAAANEVGVNVTWQGIGIVEPEVPRGKWFKISKYFDLTTVPFKPEYKLQLYFWNNSSTDILVDDYFISFGAAADRRGDSARVDMTKPAGYVPKFNYPPFPVSLLEKEPAVKGISPADIEPGDLPLAGNFFNTGNDGLIVVKKDGKIGAFAFCPSDQAFKKISLSNPAACSSISPVKKIWKGKFLSGQVDQFVVEGEKGWMLCAINAPDKICSSSGTLQSTVKILWKSPPGEKAVVAGDYNGDHRTEILEIGQAGSWNVMTFEMSNTTAGSWKVIAEGKNNPVGEWDGTKFEIGLSAGRFTPNFSNDVVLTVTRNKTDGNYGYSLRKLNLAAGKWEPLYGEKQNYSGKTIGLDTLKPADEFYAVQGQGNRTNFYRYNRDWRYDLKEIQFNDSTFRIISGIDFHGYEKDQNPKYYESLQLIPGYFSNQATVSFLVAGDIAKERHYQSILPDFVHLYSLPANK